MNEYFYCYSKPLKLFLNDNGLQEVLYAIHPRTKKKYWVFNSSDDLNNLLTEWKLRK